MNLEYFNSYAYFVFIQFAMKLRKNGVAREHFIICNEGLAVSLVLCETFYFGSCLSGKIIPKQIF